MYFQLLREHRWGLEQAAKAYSIATAEYTDPAAYGPIGGEKPNEAARRELSQFIRRLVEHAKVRAVYAWQTDGNTLVDSASSLKETSPLQNSKKSSAKTVVSDEDYTVPPPTEEVRQELSKNGYYVGSVETLSGNSGRILAYALVRPAPKHAAGSASPTPPDPPDTHAGAGNEASVTAAEIAQWRRPVGIVGVNVDASDYVVQVRVLLQRVGAIVATITAIGFILAEALSRLIVKDVRSLSAGAAAISRGELKQSVPASRIQELSDLGGAFNIMVEILQNVVAKTRRSLLEGELFRTEAELASAFADRYRPPLEQNLPGNVHLVASLCGERAVSASTFFALASPSCASADLSRDVSESGWAFVGCLVNRKNLDAAMTASAAERFIKEHLTSVDPIGLLGTEDGGSDGLLDSLFGYARQMFAARRLMICGWDAGSEKARIWRFDCTSADQRTVATFAFSTGGPPLLLHDFDMAQGEQIGTYSGFFRDLPLNELLTDIQRIVLPTGKEGAILLLRRAAEINKQEGTMNQ
ncbi:MAG: HAMP domain-containing protein [Armatimonadota bacterium]